MLEQLKKLVLKIEKMFFSSKSKIPISKIVLNNNKNQIILNRYEGLELLNDWKLINQENDEFTFFSKIIELSANSSSVLYASDQLYTASASPSELMTYADGSLSSITINGSKFGNHAGFTRAKVSVFTPLLAFQLTSLVTGQYYFNELSAKIKEIQTGIKELITLHHNERIAKLITITNSLLEYEKSKSFTTEDFTNINNLKIELENIRNEFFLWLLVWQFFHYDVK